jgi:monoamine oxidase
MTISTSSKTVIAIVGAGISGLQAARTILSHLTSQSYSVILFEARVGLGVESIRNGHADCPSTMVMHRLHILDTWLSYSGPAFTYGNPLADIAEEVGSTFLPSSVLRRYCNGEGKVLDNETAQFIYCKIWDYSAAASAYSRSEDVASGRSAEDFFESCIGNNYELEGKEMRTLFHSGLHVVSGVSSCDLNKLSLKYYWMEDSAPVRSIFSSI